MKEPPNENLEHANRQAMDRKLEDVLVFGLADHPAGIRLTRMTTTKEQYAGLSAVSGAGWDVLFYGEFAGAAAGYVGAVCGYAAEAVRVTRRDRPFHIDAWVVLPDHMHCVWTLPPGDDDYSNRWKAIKACHEPVE